jgi:hypothetical protein
MGDGFSLVLSSLIDGLLAFSNAIKSLFVARRKELKNRQNNSMMLYRVGFNSTVVIQSSNLTQIVESLENQLSRLLEGSSSQKSRIWTKHLFLSNSTLARHTLQRGVTQYGSKSIEVAGIRGKLLFN